MRKTRSLSLSFFFSLSLSLSPHICIFASLSFLSFSYPSLSFFSLFISFPSLSLPLSPYPSFFSLPLPLFISLGLPLPLSLSLHLSSFPSFIHLLPHEICIPCTSSFLKSRNQYFFVDFELNFFNPNFWNDFENFFVDLKACFSLLSLGPARTH